jgi:hypothetical protein
MKQAVVLLASAPEKSRAMIAPGFFYIDCPI